MTCQDQASDLSSLVQVSIREQLWRITRDVEDACATWNNSHVAKLDAAGMQQQLVRYQRIAADLEPQLPDGQVRCGRRFLASLFNCPAGRQIMTENPLLLFRVLCSCQLCEMWCKTELRCRRTGRAHATIESMCRCA